MEKLPKYPICFCAENDRGRAPGRARFEPLNRESRYLNHDENGPWRTLYRQLPKPLPSSAHLPQRFGPHAGWPKESEGSIAFAYSATNPHKFSCGQSLSSQVRRSGTTVSALGVFQREGFWHRFPRGQLVLSFHRCDICQLGVGADYAHASICDKH